MVQMLRVAGAERLLPKPTSPPRPPIFQRTLNFLIALAHNMDYGFHPSYSMDFANASEAGGFGGPHSGYELDAIGGYILVMMEAYETFHNRTYLEEAKIAADRLASDRGADEFFMTYELPMEAMGMLGLVKLGDATQNKSYYDLSSRPLAYTLADCTLFQADYGFRDGLPTFMALAAMSGTYVAGMEGHTSAWYVSEWLRVGATNLSPAAIALGTSYVKYAGGVLRAMYPSGMPDAALAPWAYQTGAPNNASIEIPVEDYRFDRSTPGIVGQEVYGSGAAFDMAILQRRHGAKASVWPSAKTVVATVPPSSIDSAGVGADGSGAHTMEWRPAQYLWPRTLTLRRGEAKPLTVYYPHAGLLPPAEVQKLSAQQAVLTIETAPGGSSEFSVKRAQHRTDGSGHLDVWVFASASAALGVHETVFWLNDTAVDTVVRPVRVTIDIVNPGFR